MKASTQKIIRRIRNKLAKYPKVNLVNFETPIEFLPRVSKDLNLQVYVKREDLSGPAYGGHYTSPMEYVFGEILQGDYDCVVHGGPTHSNQNRLIAALCAKFGLESQAVLRKKLQVDLANKGNLFLDLLMGAQVTWVREEMGPDLDAKKDALYAQLQKKGRKPYLFERSRISFLSCLGMLDFFLRLYEQMEKMSVKPSTIYLTGCGPTHSGILLGTLLVDTSLSVVGVRELHWDASKIVSNQVNTTASKLEEEIQIDEEDVVNYAEYVGKDYGIPTQKGIQAIQYFARKEALIFDPVYTGKMAACFLDHARNGMIEKNSRVLLIHSGGTPLTLLYSNSIAKNLRMKVTYDETQNV